MLQTIKMKPLSLIALSLLIFGPQPTTAQSTTAKQAHTLSAQLIQLHNQVRATSNYCGRRKVSKSPALRENEKLRLTAKAQVLKMLDAGKLSHSIDGKIRDRIKRTGYNAKAMSENLAFGTNTAHQTLELWMKSKGHCKNLLSRKYSEIGIFHMNGYTAAVYASPRN